MATLFFGQLCESLLFSISGHTGFVIFLEQMQQIKV